jgi:hypothetical protein
VNGAVAPQSPVSTKGDTPDSGIPHEHTHVLNVKQNASQSQASVAN